MFSFERSPWMKDALCKGVDVDVFFEARHEHEAKELCSACPVRKQCLDEAMRTEGGSPWGRFGVRGGKNPQERQRLYRKLTHPKKEAVVA
jgi:WhiB family redox-sensing transcriptional regulator